MNTDRKFEILFKRYYTQVGMYVLRLCGNTADAEDIVQEAYCMMWQKWGDESLPDNFKAYLYRTAHNLTVDRFRKGLLAPNEIALEEIEDRVPTDEEIDTSERDACLWKAVAQLPARCREVFLLSKRDGLSHKEIAARLGISTKTVENQITKAFRELRESLDMSKGKVFFLPFL